MYKTNTYLPSPCMRNNIPCPDRHGICYNDGVVTIKDCHSTCPDYQAYVADCERRRNDNLIKTHLNRDRYDKICYFTKKKKQSRVKLTY